LHDLPLTPGRKLKVWATVPQNSSSFTICIRDPDRKFYPLIADFSLANGKWSLNLRSLQKSTNGTQQRQDLGWLKAGDPIQMEMEYTSTVFKVSLVDSTFWMKI